MSFYGGNDHLYSFGSEDFSHRRESGSVGAGWGNLTATARWTHASPQLFASVTLLHSRYHIGGEISQEEEADGETRSDFISFGSTVHDWGARVDANYAPGGNHVFETGLAVTRHVYLPGAYRERRDWPGQEPVVTNLEDHIPALEANAYLEDQVRLSPTLTATAGLHASSYTVEDASFLSLQPRLALSYWPSERWRLRGAFSRMRQYIHLLVNSGIGLPTALWVPATGEVRPEAAWQVEAGIDAYLGSDRRYEARLEGYFKHMNSVVSYREGASFIDTGREWEARVTSGQGRAYGLELLVQKSRGRTTGWIAYTLSRSERQFDKMGRGDWFPFRYDRRHDLGLALNRRLSARRTLSLTWTFQTGHAITLPIGKFSLPSTGLPFVGGGRLSYDYYGTRNGHRMRPYHRLDLAYRIRYPKRWGKTELSFGLYNAYSRFNSFLAMTGSAPGDENDAALGSKTVYREVGLLPALPFISYGFTF